MSSSPASSSARKAPSTPDKSLAESTDQGITDLLRNLALAPGKGSPASPVVEQHSTRRYSAIGISMTYATSSAKESNATPSKSENVQKPDGEATKAEVVVVVEKLVIPPSPPRKALAADVERFVKQLQEAKNVIVMVGAGLSVAAGIPDFRTPGTGLYSQLAKYKLPKPEAVFEIGYFARNPEPFRQLACELWPGRKYFPTMGHHFVKLLNDKGKLLRCYTQNIDSLEHMTGLPKEKIVAAHGNFDSATCIVTKKKIANMDEVRDAYINNKHAELNKKYGTKLVKPDIVFFGEELPVRFHELVPVDFEKADLLIVMGTSLQVHPFASLVTMSKRGVPRMLINRERVGGNLGLQFGSSKTLDVFLKGDCDDGCLVLAEALGWDAELKDISKPRL